MNLQDFACKMSELIWGGELGWDRENGLEELSAQIQQKLNQNESNYFTEDELFILSDAVKNLIPDLPLSANGDIYDDLIEKIGNLCCKHDRRKE